ASHLTFECVTGNRKLFMWIYKVQFKPNNLLTIRNLFKLLLLAYILTACYSDTRKTEPIVTDKDLPKLFKLLSPDHTNIHFANTLTEGLNTNVLMYEYFYNGGGVATGDVNNDGLDDIYFTSNMETN